MTEQEIKAKALELAIASFALMTEIARDNAFKQEGNKIQQTIINTSQIYERHIKGS